MARTLELRPQDARAIARGHPWVYRQALSRKAGKLRAGEVVDVSAPGRPFLGRGIADPGSSVAVRVWTRDERTQIDEPLLTTRIRQAAALRDELGLAERTNAFRVVNAEGDGLPGLVIDRYGDWLSVEIQTPALRPWRDRIARSVVEALAPRGAYFRDGPRTTLLCGEACPESGVEVHEPTGRFRVLVQADGKCGLFSDMRDVRVRLAALVPGKSLLNLFAHTGAFSAAAAAAAASQVTSVDLSASYLELATQNVELSAPGYRAHESVPADVFETLTDLARNRRTFDVVLCDPPSFSTSRKGGTFSVEGRYASLVRASLRVLAPGGHLICATNFRGIARPQFLRLLHDGAQAHGTGLSVHEILGQPPDYPILPVLPESAYLQVALCRLRPGVR